MRPDSCVRYLIVVGLQPDDAHVLHTVYRMVQEQG